MEIKGFHFFDDFDDYHYRVFYSLFDVLFALLFLLFIAYSMQWKPAIIDSVERVSLCGGTFSNSSCGRGYEFKTSRGSFETYDALTSKSQIIGYEIEVQAIPLVNYVFSVRVNDTTKSPYKYIKLYARLAVEITLILAIVYLVVTLIRCYDYYQNKDSDNVFLFMNLSGLLFALSIIYIPLTLSIAALMMLVQYKIGGHIDQESK